MRSGVALAVICALFLAPSLIAADRDVIPVLDTASFWRFHFTLQMPAIRQDDSLKKLPEVFAKEWTAIDGDRNAKWLEYDTPFPPAQWTTPDFDDRSWLRMPGQPLAKTYREKRGFGYQSSPYIALLCMRGRFRVDDPAEAAGLTLSLEYSGGVVVYLNGRELTRAHLAPGPLAPSTPAEDYAQGSSRIRSLANVAVPSSLLRKGVNVLAVEIHRAPYAPSDFWIPERDNWRRLFTLGPSTCVMHSLRLEAPAGSPVLPNVARPKGLQLWNSDPLAPDFDLDYGDPNELLRPVDIVAARNGAFSGKVVLGSDSPIRGFKAAISQFTHSDRTHRISAAAVQIRYASPALIASVEGSIDFVHFYGGTEAGAEARYLAEPARFDALNELPPAEVPIYEKKSVKGCLSSPGVLPSFGAVVPVWLTVHVPADASPGDYSATLTLTAAGSPPRSLPVLLHVSAFRLPDPKDFRTFIELIESPESVAFQYDVPLWSDRHFQYLEKSLSLLGLIGSRTAYIPLISETNLGNSQSMVRWIKHPDGSCSYDFSVLDRYLDLLQKHQSDPLVVCFVVWDVFLHGVSDEDYHTEEARMYQGGPEVTLLDPASGGLSKLKLPLFTDPSSPELWRPLLSELRARMKARGLESSMMLGLVSDRMPDKPTVAFFQDLLPGVPWVSLSHIFPEGKHGIPFGYQANVFENSYVLDPSVARTYGWKRPGLVHAAHFPRLFQDIFPLTGFHFLAEMEIARDYRGVARLGADLWPVLKDRKGNRVGRIAARYPKSAWWNLNVITSLLSPGPDGALATVRYEALRQGVQECEARIVLERALTDRDLRARLGEPLATRAQDLLDRRTRDMLRAVSCLVQTDDSWANSHSMWWERPGIIGSQYYLSTDHGRHTADLFTAAADVQRALASSAPKP